MVARFIHPVPPRVYCTPLSTIAGLDSHDNWTTVEAPGGVDSALTSMNGEKSEKAGPKGSSASALISPSGMIKSAATTTVRIMIDTGAINTRRIGCGGP